MIHYGTVTINGREFDHTYSDTYFIERDGVEYPDAVDPLGSGRVYTETENLLPVEEPKIPDVPEDPEIPDEPEDEEATIEDYQAALAELGVDTHEEE